jgi:MATE family multidrug resistance protein
MPELLRQTRAELGPTLRLAVPIMLGMLGYGLMFITDVAMAARLGETALAASALAGNLNYIPYVFGIGVVGAIQVYQSQDNGAGVASSAPAILRHGMALALVLSVALAALCHLLAPLLPFLGSDAAVTAEARGYFVIMSWAMVPGLLFHALRVHRDSQHQPWVSLAWLAFGLAANVLLNWILMYGNWGAPALGLDGAAWATLASRVLMLAGLWLTPGRGEVLWSQGLSRPVFDRLLRTGVPAGFHSLSEVGIFAVVPVIAGWISPTAQAAHQVAVSTASAAFMLPLGLGMAAGIRAGEARGADDRARARAIGLGSLLLAAVVMGAYALALLVLRQPLLVLYDVDATVTGQLAAALLIWAALWAPFDALQVVAAHLLRSINLAAWASWVAAATYWGIALPLCLILAFPLGFGAVGIWIGLATSLGFAALALVGKFLRATRPGAPGWDVVDDEDSEEAKET